MKGFYHLEQRKEWNNQMESDGEWNLLEEDDGWEAGRLCEITCSSRLISYARSWIWEAPRSCCCWKTRRLLGSKTCSSFAFRSLFIAANLQKCSSLNLSFLLRFSWGKQWSGASYFSICWVNFSSSCARIFLRCSSAFCNNYGVQIQVPLISEHRFIFLSLFIADYRCKIWKTCDLLAYKRSLQRSLAQNPSGAPKPPSWLNRCTIPSKGLNNITTKLIDSQCQHTSHSDAPFLAVVSSLSLCSGIPLWILGNG